MSTPQITTFPQYQALYKESIDNPDKFWAEQAEKFITWTQPWDTVSAVDFIKGDINWFVGAKLNASFNCIDRHLATKGESIAILWEGNEPGTSRQITYNELFLNVCKMANVLKSFGIKVGDRVCIYMPMIPEAVFAMLACARIGAIHSVVFGGFSPEALNSRVKDSGCKLIVTADAAARGNKAIPCKQNVDQALQDADSSIKVLVVQHAMAQIPWIKDRDYWLHELLTTVDAECDAPAFSAEQPLFMLYTSGSTGKPKGIVHTTGGYLVYAAITHKYIFDYQDQEVYWCTADIGWITGHTYLVYGPLANGATILMYEGVPTYPTPARLWEIIDQYKVTTFYTAPTLLRSLMANGDEYLASSTRASLKVLGSVGEPISPDTWEWYQQKVGNGACPIVDTWWQTETGGILISPLPGVTNLKPGSATLPFFGIQPEILDMQSNVAKPAKEGFLVFATSWPGQARTIYKDHERFVATYFKQYPGFYFSGDAAMRDEDGFYWITGRVDDVINVSGHRLSTAEIESILVTHDKVAEAAVIGAKHGIKGESVYAFVKLGSGINPSDRIKQELINLVKTKVGSFAAPENIHWAPDLPKTRSGKIMRRILRKIANKETDDLGDTSTLTDPQVVDQLLGGN